MRIASSTNTTNKQAAPTARAPSLTAPAPPAAPGLAAPAASTPPPAAALPTPAAAVAAAAEAATAGKSDHADAPHPPRVHIVADVAALRLVVVHAEHCLHLHGP
jgi:hypothetical protein